MIDLRDCPFCGGQADVIVKLPLYGFSGVVIKCRYCGAKIENCKGCEQIHEEKFMATPITQRSLSNCLFDTIRMWNKRNERANARCVVNEYVKDADEWLEKRRSENGEE